MEDLKPLLEKANKILSELEALELNMGGGKFFEQTKKNLHEKLEEISNRILYMAGGGASKITHLSSSANQTAARTEEKEFLGQSTLKDIRRKIKSRRTNEKKAVKSPADEIEIRNPNFYVRAANLFFKEYSNRLLQKGHFKELTMGIRKSGLNILVHSYISLIFLNVIIAFIIGVLLGIFLSLFSVKLAFSLIPLKINTITPTALGFIRNLLIWPFIVTSLVFLLSYYWPNLEANARRSKIHDDLPFAVIHMSAIAGSGVEPTKIFRLISETVEYREFAKEARRVVNKINLYGYDLTTALKESARVSASPRAKDLFNGMATTIATGGDLKLFLEKKASDSMTEYKLARKKFAEASGTYADVYTGVLIAAPLIFGIMIAIMAPLGGKVFGISVQSLSVLGLVSIAVLNIAFLLFVKMVQPSD